MTVQVKFTASKQIKLLRQTTFLLQVSLCLQQHASPHSVHASMVSQREDTDSTLSWQRQHPMIHSTTCKSQKMRMRAAVCPTYCTRANLLPVTKRCSCKPCMHSKRFQHLPMCRFWHACRSTVRGIMKLQLTVTLLLVGAAAVLAGASTTRNSSHARTRKSRANLMQSSSSLAVVACRTGLQSSASQVVPFQSPAPTHHICRHCHICCCLETHPLTWPYASHHAHHMAICLTPCTDCSLFSCRHSIRG